MSGAEDVQAKADAKQRRKRFRKEVTAERQGDPALAAAAKRDRKLLAKTRGIFLRENLAGFLHRPVARSLKAERLLLIDIGARGGLPEEWAPAIPLLRVIGFEPDPRPARGKTLYDGMEFVPKAVAGTGGSRPFFHTQSPSGSSLLTPDPAVIERYRDFEGHRVVDVVAVETTTIDDVARERQLAFVDAIKLDTQGSELEILQGARETLARLAFCVATEVEFVRLYENQPLFSDLDPFVRSQGFELMSLGSLRRFHRNVQRFDELGLAGSAGQLVTADALYFRTSGHVAALLERLDGTARVRYLAGAVVVCLIYSRADYAAHLVEITTPLIGTDVAEDLYGAIESYQRVLTSPLDALAGDDGQISPETELTPDPPSS